MANIDLDEEFLQLFYDITNSDVPCNLSLSDLKKQLSNVVETLRNLNKTSKKPIESRALREEDTDMQEIAPAILVVDDLGVITYQLKVLLSQFKMEGKTCLKHKVKIMSSLILCILCLKLYTDLQESFLKPCS